MKIVAITIAYCPAVLLARMFLTQSERLDAHYVILGHYPINKKKNNNDIKLLCDAAQVQLLDPGVDLGSAQSQNWALSQIGLKDEDYFINLDPDSNGHLDWDIPAIKVLNADPACVLISCMAPMVQRYGKPLKEENIVGIRVGVPLQPTPFNLGLWRYSFIKEIGGIPQLGLSWGDTEGVFYSHCMMRGKYHAYLLDYMEDELGKQMQDIQHAEYKDRHMRTIGDKHFVGNYEEFLRYEYPQLLELDTCRNLNDLNFR